MAAVEVLPIERIRRDAQAFVAATFVDTVTLEGLYLHGSVPNAAAAPHSDLDILFVLPDGVSSLTCAKVESFSETYEGFPADTYAIPDGDAMAYLQTSCQRNDYNSVYDVLACERLTV